MLVSDFDFDLPTELIAQEPPTERGGSRLLCLDRQTGSVVHSRIADLPDVLRQGDLVVLNNTRVFPARLLGRRVPGGGAAECLLIRKLGQAEAGGEFWEALVHPGQRLKPGARIIFENPSGELRAEVLERLFHGRRVVRLWSDTGARVDTLVDQIGHMPLPPYIRRDDGVVDRDRYQTVFARERGSIAAPTAGLHFSQPLLTALRERGVEVVHITLHVGYGTFQPIRTERVEDHRLEPERFEIPSDTAAAVNRTKAAGNRVIAVGTTTTRALEAVARTDGFMSGYRGETDLFIVPGFEFKVVDGLLTNFHLPRSSLLMLVSAFAGRDRVLAAYREAVTARYRFFSYGDAMFVV